MNTYGLVEFNFLQSFRVVVCCQGAFKNYVKISFNVDFKYLKNISVRQIFSVSHLRLISTSNTSRKRLHVVGNRSTCRNTYFLFVVSSRVIGFNQYSLFNMCYCWEDKSVRKSYNFHIIYFIFFRVYTKKFCKLYISLLYNPTLLCLF